MRSTTKRCLTAAITGLLAVAPAASAQVAPGTPDNTTSDNVSHVGSFKLVGDGVGARVVGNTMYVTSTTHLMIFDITNATDPQLLGSLTADVEFENEDVPTNGKVLGISGSISASCANPTSVNCLNIYDVSDPENPSLLSSVDGAGDHTSECILDCTYFYGSEGNITDARDPANAEIVGDWAQMAEEQGVSFVSSPHAVREVAPGYVVTSTQPSLLMSLNPKEGGSPTNPVVLAYATNEDGRFIHSAEWPRQGRDKWLLLGGETVLDAQQCNDESAAFMTWDASKVVDPAGGYFKDSNFTLVDEIRMRNGTFTDSYNPYNIFGCSVHWFQEHPAFRNGGLVAVSAYEHGTRIYQVTSEGKIVEQGYAMPAAGAASAPHWHPDGKVFYTIDYQRGMDIWEYSGDTFVGPADDAPPSAGGGGGADEPPALQLTLGKVKRAKARSVARRGLTFTATCSRTCDIAAKLAKGRRVVAKASKRGATGTTRIRLKVAKKHRRKLRPGTYRLSVVATAADGRSADALKRVKLR